MNKYLKNGCKGVLGTALFLSTVAQAAIINQPVSVTVRDFHQIHPDFQYAVSGVTTGMVGNTLVGGKPVFIGAPGYGAVNNAQTFSTWFSNCNAATPGVTCVNQYNVNINATVDTSTGKLTYNNSSFFPLDPITGITNDGDQFNEHNYFFTAQFGLNLIYDPKLINTFSFTGDDDVWVFINDTLVLDLGGVHAAATKGFNMNTVASQLGIQAGQQYKFDFFFAERHYSQSTVNFESYLGAPVDVPEPSSLALLSLSILGLAGAARRRRRA